MKREFAPFIPESAEADFVKKWKKLANELCTIMQSLPDIPDDQQASFDCVAWWKSALSVDSPDRLAFFHVNPSYLIDVVYSLLCIPATSAPAERLFSAASLLMTKRQCNIHCETLREKLVLRHFVTSCDNVVEFLSDCNDAMKNTVFGVSDVEDICEFDFEE